MGDLVPKVLGLQPSFGFGDRLGLATPGHVAALLRTGKSIVPILPQQSIREMARTDRQPQDVMGAAIAGAKQAGYTGISGADADHLKTPEDVDRMAAAGFTFFTIDPSGEVDEHADSYSASQLAEKYKAVAGLVTWVSAYEGKTIKLSNGTAINFTTEVCQRAAVKYGKAILMTIKLAGHIEAVHKKLGRAYEIELSVDETPNPTTLAEHYIIADQIAKAGVKLISLAPRFIGELEKGIDYIGNVKALETSLADHAVIAKTLGPYKISLHSGSDKISIYPSLARATKGVFHVKTAGTSYLEALRVVAHVDAALFKEIVNLSRAHYDTDKATYHVHATLASAPAADKNSDIKALEKAYLGLWKDAKKGEGLSDPGRQILHCCFGTVMRDPKFGPLFKACVKDNQKLYTEILDEHFGRHLDALNEGM